MSVATYTKSGAKATTPAKLDKNVFDIEVSNHELLKKAYHAYLANGRVNLAVTKTRGLVRGGGKKPWKQKGTGRARFGSSRNPIWRGGGIVFGPTGHENYKIKLSTESKRLAIRQALSLAHNSGKVKVIESFVPADAKTAATAKLLDKLDTKGTTLLVVANKDDQTVRATRNLADLIVVQAKYVNVYDVLNADQVVITKDALTIVSDWLAATPAKEAKQ